ncbi:zinc-dependent alcohol dehydrogenase family protein [Chroococcidiopsis sp. FACHB-1243]|uniref:zinc-dependent alcohol dehydrogenase family protein n=1 Tax=Chroococcidiopsis sp. [FACHB-1243] TaxID=2692781 RepID=UPI001783B91E|nr:zinc-dependent alcohol dehydrogenase family protein [Chroococcidiopsis sp. [FACHB-1243]]MBD2308375.1 zinc-dependent alcohol dehydrogenase family protein [Chroococcidiopsis sp. [FACHB-1243]]
MKAQAIVSFGEPSVFQTIELPKPEVIPGHVLIRVAATSVNPVDFKLRRGAMPAIAPEFPAVLHGDVAGVVEAVGEGVTTFKPGDEVYGCAGGFKGMGGALAEYMLADADLLALKPKSLSMKEAAALPLVAITAWESLIYRAKIQPGQKVLVHAATGGVGHIGIQLAKWAGAKVYTTVSNEEKKAIAHHLGVNTVINYRQQTVEEYVAAYTSGKGFDVVFDTVGKDNLDRSFAAAAMHGTVVSISTRSTHDLSPLHAKGLTLHVVFMLLRMLYGTERAEHGKILFNVAKLVDQGTIRPLLDPKSFRFSEVAEAHRYAESGQAVGKVVLEV